MREAVLIALDGAPRTTIEIQQSIGNGSGEFVMYGDVYNALRKLEDRGRVRSMRDDEGRVLWWAT